MSEGNNCPYGLCKPSPDCNTCREGCKCGVDCPCPSAICVKGGGAKFECVVECQTGSCCGNDSCKCDGTCACPKCGSG